MPQDTWCYCELLKINIQFKINNNKKQTLVLIYFAVRFTAWFAVLQPSPAARRAQSRHSGGRE